MAAGAYIVSEDRESPGSILFSLAGQGDPPEDQRELQIEVERAVGVLQRLLPQRGPEFAYLFKQVLSLSQAGLVGPSAAPRASAAALATLKDDVVGRYGASVKNRYMRQLGRAALGTAGPAAAALVALAVLGVGEPTLLALLFAWVGFPAGVWVSFGIRKRVLAFEDLVRPEEDRMEPGLRMAFAGVLTTILVLAMILGAFEVRVGSLSSDGLVENGWLAALVGALCGVSELTLPQKVVGHAGAWLREK